MSFLQMRTQGLRVSLTWPKWCSYWCVEWSQDPLDLAPHCSSLASSANGVSLPHQSNPSLKTHTNQQASKCFVLLMIQFKNARLVFNMYPLHIYMYVFVYIYIYMGACAMVCMWMSRTTHRSHLSLHVGFRDPTHCTMLGSKNLSHWAGSVALRQIVRAHWLLGVSPGTWTATHISGSLTGQLPHAGASRNQHLSYSLRF